MENKMFGKEIERKVALGSTLDDFKDLMLYHLEDYLFKTKFNDKVTNVYAPFLGINYTEGERYSLDLRSYFDMPLVSFDNNGCLYNNGEESAYISPEFFGKCFIERVVDVLASLYKLYSPKLMKKEIDGVDGPLEMDGKKEKFPHMDFVDIYNKLVAIKRVNNDMTKGLIGLLPDYRDNNRILNLRKIEFAAQVQRDIEFVIDMIKKDVYECELSDFDNSKFYESEEFKKLEKEHDRLFRMGPFVEALEAPEWQVRERHYDEGTDEERDEWRQKYDNLKKDYEQSGIREIQESIPDMIFPMSEIKDKVVDYLKAKILIYDYERNIGAPGNPYINELGLDKTAYFAHPSDKNIPERTCRRFGDYSIEDVDPYDYDIMFGIGEDDDEFESGNSNVYYKKI